MKKKVRNCKIVIEWSEKDKEFVVWSPKFPTLCALHKKDTKALKIFRDMLKATYKLIKVDTNTPDILKKPINGNTKQTCQLCGKAFSKCILEKCDRLWKED